MSIDGNGANVGQPTAADPIADSNDSKALAFTGFENLVGAATADDWFDLRNGAGLSGSLDGGGHGPQGDSLDYRDFSSSNSVTVDLTSGAATNIGGNLLLQFLWSRKFLLRA